VKFHEVNSLKIVGIALDFNDLLTPLPKSVSIKWNEHNFRFDQTSSSVNPHLRSQILRRFGSLGNLIKIYLALSY